MKFIICENSNVSLASSEILDKRICLKKKKPLYISVFNTNSEICDPWISAKALALWPSGECGEKRSVTSYTLTMFCFLLDPLCYTRENSYPLC